MDERVEIMAKSWMDGWPEDDRDEGDATDAVAEWMGDVLAALESAGYEIKKREEV